MPAPYPGIYRAKALRLDTGNQLAALIPQIFGEETVTITAFVGDPPAASEMGWVAFHGGMPSNPVWLGVGTGGGGGGGTVTDVLHVGTAAPTDPAMELWWDTDETVPLDPRYLPSAGGTMAGHITLPTSDPPGNYSAVHNDWMMRWINLSILGSSAAPVLAGSWEDYPSFQGGRVTKLGYIVVCQGLVRRIVGAPTFTTGTVATVPVGFRPTNQQVLYTLSSGGPARVDITPAGLLTVGATPVISLVAGSWITLQFSWVL